MAGWSGLVMAPLLALQAARGQLLAWVPVFLSLGIGMWFAWPVAPGPVLYAGAGLMLAAAILGSLAAREILHPPLIALGAVGAGVLAVGLRVALVAAPVLPGDYHGPVQGMVVEVDRSQSDALRLVLAKPVLRDVAPADTPAHLRISLQGQEPQVAPGDVVLVTARLSPPGGPVEPGAFDFQRMAFFDRLGAVGYSRDPLVLWSEAEGTTQAINRLRAHLGAAVRGAIGGDAGAFAAGAMTGDRSGIRTATVEALRDSNLAHLLAISGMNMAFLTGFVFALVRYGLALVPPLALRVNLKKLAAVVALGVAGFYLLLSGANVATERAFLMVTVMLVAVMIDRRALTLRTVAVAAVVILLWQPEELLEPGFQLSFAATVVLVSGFRLLDAHVLAARIPGWVMVVYFSVLSSVLAGLATAPYAAAHFNRFTDYGLVANLLAAPAMSVLMAAGALAVLLAPFGLAGVALWVMGKAAGWILWVAHWVAGLEGAVTPIVAPGAWPLVLITLAGIWAVLVAGRARAVAAAPLVAGLVLWALTERPVLLIAEDGRLVGLLGPEGRALSLARGAGFAAEGWLENDGDLATQAEAARRPGFEGPAGARRFAVAGLRGVALSGKGAATALEAACAEAALVISTALPPEGWQVPPGCQVIEPGLLARTGALAGHLRDGALVLTPARAIARPWHGPTPPLPPIRVAEFAP